MSELNKTSAEFNNTCIRFSGIILFKIFFSYGTSKFLRGSESVSFLDSQSVLASGLGGHATLIIVFLTSIFTETTKSLFFLFFNYNNKPLEAMRHNDFTTGNGCFFWHESLNKSL